KYAFAYFTPVYMIAFRFTIGVLAMCIFFWKKISKITLKDLKGGIIVGIIFFIAFVTQLIALQYTEAGKQAFLAATYVVMAPFLYWIIYHKKPDFRTLAGAFICFLGIGLLTLNASLSISFGDGLTLFSSLFFALHIMFNGYFVEKQDPVILSTVQFAVVAIISWIFAFFFEPFPTAIGFEGIASVLYLGIFCTGLAYFLQTAAQRYTLATHAAIILSLESVFGILLAVVMLGEVFTLRMLMGCIAIFGAILITELRSSSE
nr:DMT family transporter [Acetoanaerobium sp.]